MRGVLVFRLVLCVFVAAAAAGCPNYELAPLEPCTVSGVAIEVPQTSTKLDVLFVVDDSGSMLQEQTALGRELPSMVEILASGDLDGDGEADFPAVQDMHLGVVSTDMGAAGNQLPSCEGLGANGQLLFPSECSGSREGNYLAFQRGDDVTALGNAFTCITQLGTDGCGLEQQLDAMLKAVTPPSIPTTFFGNSLGHGGPAGAGTPNAGFLRDDAVLAVILVTDEDDCSIPDASAALMDSSPDGPYGDQPLNLRCGLNPDALHPISRYTEGLLALKPLNPELVIFAAIVGIDPSLEGADAQVILDHPSMQFRSDTAPGEPGYGSAEPEPSCTFPNPDFDPSLPEGRNNERNQKAAPPRRIVQTAAAFGNNGVVRSLCQESFASALDAIIAKISDQLPEPCLPQPLIRNELGRVECDVVELLPDPGGMGPALCDTTKGRRALGQRPFTDEATGTSINMQECAIDQVPVRDQTLLPNAESQQVVGWFYDDFSDQLREQCPGQPQQIRFTADADPDPGTVVSLECQRPVSGASDESRGREAVGLGCEGKDTTSYCQSRSCTAQEVSPLSRACDKPYALACEAQTNTCQIACQTDAQCPGGWVCYPDPEQGGLCVRPTCSPLSFDDQQPPALSGGL